jgi:hypothetical protein
MTAPARLLAPPAAARRALRGAALGLGLTLGACGGSAPPTPTVQTHHTVEPALPEAPATPAHPPLTAPAELAQDEAPSADLAAVDAAVELGAAAPSAPLIPGAPLNKTVLRLLESYPTDGTYTYYWKRGQHTDGTSRTLRWGETVLAEGSPAGQVHCSGITWELWLRALDESGGAAVLQPQITGEELLALRATWYVEDGSLGGPVDALTRRGLAQRVDRLDDLRPGDFVQFWRNSGKGHSAVFIDHIRNPDGSARGMIYWSAQQSSGGLGKRRVSVGDGEFQIAPGRLHGARAILPAGAIPSAAVAAATPSVASPPPAAAPAPPLGSAEAPPAPAPAAPSSATEAAAIATREGEAHAAPTAAVID